MKQKGQLRFPFAGYAGYPNRKIRPQKGGAFMASTHFKVSIVKSSANQSAVAAAAYQSGSRLYRDADMRYHNYSSKTEVIYETILLPAHAPACYKDRQTLWNAVEKVECNCNAQQARKIQIAIPVEIPAEQFRSVITEYCQKEFVDKGMCCDIAIHDKGDGNPHAHILLTMRALDKDGNWLAKSRKEYILDEDGSRIRLPSGAYKSRKVNTVDWNERGNVELWRSHWQEHVNGYLERCQSDVRIDMRSYERQGIAKIPTVHLGPAVSALEKKGIQTDLGNLNREIKMRNRLWDDLLSIVKRIYDKWQELRSPKPQEESLANYLSHYIDIRSRDRKEKNYSPIADVKCLARDWSCLNSLFHYLYDQGIYSKGDLLKHIQSLDEQVVPAKQKIKTDKARMKDIEIVLNARKKCKELQPLIDEYEKIFFKSRKQKFKEEHKEEISSYYKSKKCLETYHSADAKKSVTALTKEKAVLQEQINQHEKVTALTLTDPEKLIRRMVRVINSETSTRQVEVRSIHDRIADGKKRTACISNDTPAAKKNNQSKNTKTR